jgi:hypothetical protein
MRMGGGIVADRPGVFLLQGSDTLVAMEPTEFVKEDHFQELVSRFPELLVGDQIDPEDPRRWILVNREQTISTGEVGGPSWAIDLVFLDQDGIPTLVEIKRKSDSRLRREVVGQMLDYAANCISYWSAESLKLSFETMCAATARSSNGLLSELLQDGQTEEQFWSRVTTNLEARKIRLLFVADEIPIEIRRVVEFLNSQMSQTEVLAVELRQFASGELRTIVPTVHGHSPTKPGRVASISRRWDEKTLFEKLSQTVGAKELAFAHEIYNWMRKDGKRLLNYGTGRENGSVYPVFKPAGVPINPVYLSTDGKVWIQFGSLKNKPVFGDLAARAILMQHFNEIPGVKLTEADLARYPSIPLSVISTDPQGPSKFLNALKWMEQQIGNAT